MGGGRWSGESFKSYAKSSSYDSKSTEEIYSSRHLHQDLDPKKIKVRESRDSNDNPVSNAIIVGLDVTGSMGAVLDAMARHGLNTLATEIHNLKPVTDPHIMCLGIGDIECDTSPLQATQFEADLRIIQQLEKIWLEGGGGGNNYESYALAWYFADKYTSIDCFEKRQKKGYLFTVGDELPTPSMSATKLGHVFGSKISDAPTIRQLLKSVSEKYNVFHLMVEEGSYFRSNEKQVVKEWTELLGQRAIRLADHGKMAEVIVSSILVSEGKDPEEVLSNWKGDVHLVVSKAIEGLRRVEI